MKQIRVDRSNPELYAKIQSAVTVALLMQHEILIGCTESKSQPGKLVAESVIRYDISGPISMALTGGKHPVWIEYDVDRCAVTEGEPFLHLHDSLAKPVLRGADVTDLVRSACELFDTFIIDEGYVDRTHIYGKLGTPAAETIIFSYEEN